MHRPSPRPTPEHPCPHGLTIEDNARRAIGHFDTGAIQSKGAADQGNADEEEKSEPNMELNHIGDTPGM